MILLIGHRGAGKTQFLYWCKKHNLFNGSHYFDLDQVIIEETGQSIETIFSQFGEEYFRNLEVKLLHDLQVNYPYAVIATGAGCQLNKLALPLESHIIWIRRSTDLKPRFFLNRPALSHYQDRIPRREQMYAQFCDQIIEIPEGLDLDHLPTDLFNFSTPMLPDTCITLTDWYTHKVSRNKWLLLQGPHEWVEIRTDLVPLDQIEKIILPILSQIRKKILLSIRTPSAHYWLKWAIYNQLNFKIDIEEQYFTEYSSDDYLDSLKFVSSHQNEIPNPLITNSYPIKWSPRLTSWKSLIQALDWKKNETQKLNYLMPRLEFPDTNPIHQSWIRLYLSNRQNFHFIRGCPQGSANNQPHWLSFALNATKPIHHWLAVLGQPIEHSISPTYHAEFAKNHQSAFLAIPVTLENFDSAIQSLCKLEFKGFAITSPLKIKAAQQNFIKNSPLVNHLGSANTLVNIKGHWQAFNTDLIGVGLQLYKNINFYTEIDIPIFIHTVGNLNSLELSPLAQNLKQSLELLSSDFLIFGGGGMLPILKWWLPKAHNIKSRDTQSILSNAKYFIWAATNEADLPSLAMKNLTTVIDLNYTQSSPAIELAKKMGVSYQSGELLFKTQAYCQQQLWQQAYLEDKI